MTGFRARAIAAFEKYAEEIKSKAVAHFKKDFRVLPDETVYLGDHRFLFRADDLYIRGYIEYIGDCLYGKSYRLAFPCPSCTGFVFDKKFVDDLPSLGEALKMGPNLGKCEKCGGQPIPRDKGDTLNL